MISCISVTDPTIVAEIAALWAVPRVCGCSVVLADGPEEPLLGGDVTEGLVRIGDTVRRPRLPESALVEAVLTFLEDTDFDGAPRFLGIDNRGRQALSFVHGQVAGRPWPDWIADDERAASVARLLRRLDDAMQPFGIPQSSVDRR